MPRGLRARYPGAIYRVLSRAKGKGNIFETDVDREQRRESAEAKAEGIIRERVERLGWSEGQLCQRPQKRPHQTGHGRAVAPGNDAVPAARIAARLHTGTWKGLNANLYRWRKANETTNGQSRL